jgi:hypothetical protein
MSRVILRGCCKPFDFSEYILCEDEDCTREPSPQIYSVGQIHPEHWHQLRGPAVAGQSCHALLSKLSAGQINYHY